MCYILDQVEGRGIEKGKKEGRQEAKEEIILKMIENNLSDAEIKQYTGASLKTIKELKAKLVCVTK